MSEQKKKSRWGAPTTPVDAATGGAQDDSSEAVDRRQKALAIAQMLTSKLGDTGSGLTGNKRPREEESVDGRKRRKVFVPSSQAKEAFVASFTAKQAHLEAKSGASISISGQGSGGGGSDEDLHVVITGDSEQTLNIAEDMVQDLFLAPTGSSGFSNGPPTTSRFSSAPPSGGALPSFVPMNNMPSTRTIEIPNDKVGLVIGRGGDSIKQIQAMSGAQVQIAPEPPQWAPTRTVTLTGSTQQMEAAEREISNICDHNDRRPGGDRGNDRGPGGGFGGAPQGGPGLGYGSSKTVTISIPNQMVGLLIGKGGETIRNLQAHTGAHIQVTRDSEANPNANERQVSISGTEQQVATAEAEIRNTLQNVDNHSGNKIMIPNHTVGMIIGRGGETIRGLIQKTGARIQISKDDHGPEREVTLQGQHHEVEYAKAEIYALVNEAESRNGGGGGRGGGGGGGHGGPYGQQPYGGPGGPYGGAPHGGGGGYGGYGAPYGGQPHHGGPPRGQGPQGPPAHQQGPPQGGPQGGPGPSGAPASAASGQDQMAAYTQWAQQYFQYYGQYPPQYDPTYVQQWQTYYQQLAQYNQQGGGGAQPPGPGQAQAPPTPEQKSTPTPAPEAAQAEGGLPPGL